MYLCSEILNNNVTINNEESINFGSFFRVIFSNWCSGANG